MITQAKLVLLTKGLTQVELARRIARHWPERGMTKAGVCQVISGVRQTAWIRRAIAQELKVSVERLWPNGNRR